MVGAAIHSLGGYYNMTAEAFAGYLGAAIHSLGGYYNRGPEGPASTVGCSHP